MCSKIGMTSRRWASSRSSWHRLAAPRKDDHVNRVFCRRADPRAILGEVEAGIAEGPFSPDWDSLTRGLPGPGLVRDGKFGIFIHWGPYCVPGYANEWYPRADVPAGHGESTRTTANLRPARTFGYKDFIPDFTGIDFDPVAWASLFRRAGAQFVVPVAEHHDGFAMYDSDLTRWNAAADGAGPGRGRASWPTPYARSPW